MSDSKTKYYTFTGISRFSRLNTPDQYDNYSQKVEFVDSDELYRYKASGIQLTLDENAVFFKRPDSKIINKELFNLGSPKVFIIDDDGKEVPFDGLIGGGSKVSVRVRAYPTQKGIGHTLDEVIVHELVPVESGGRYGD